MVISREEEDDDDGIYENPSLKNLTRPNYGEPKSSPNQILKDLPLPHLESFNFIFQDGLRRAVKSIPAIEFALENGSRVKIQLSSVDIHPPKGDKATGKLFPSHCRIMALTYAGDIQVEVNWWLNGKLQDPIAKKLGELPIMVKSHLCNLRNLSPKELVRHKEEEDEAGGYFIIKGKEKVMRMLIATRRNYPIAVVKNSWKTRGKGFTEFGIKLRCVANDETSTNNVLHLLKDGNMKLMFSYCRELFFSPLVLILKALVPVTDAQIYEKLIAGWKDSTAFKGSVDEMLRSVQEHKLYTYSEARKYIGRAFRDRIAHMAPWHDDEQVCDYLLRDCVAIHLTDFQDKFDLLVLMAQKLMGLKVGEYVVESEDNTSMHEVLLGGHLYLQVLKDKLYSWLSFRKEVLLKMIKFEKGPADDEMVARKMLAAVHRSPNVGQHLQNFLATGALRNLLALTLPQLEGLAVVAENINRMRYLSHFRAIHRGSFFTEMRTSEPRKLTPDAWGFICPVHTPDGSPCGLLNHLASGCTVVTQAQSERRLPQMFANLGMMENSMDSRKDCYPVMWNGGLMGYIIKEKAQKFVADLRLLKCEGKIYDKTEIVFSPLRVNNRGPFPGVFIFSSRGRMIRKVYNLQLQAEEYIGSFEQMYLDVAVIPDEIIPGVTTHLELNQTNYLSNLACLIPLPDFNQSPRNMYQCQMGKQTMGTPCHNYRDRPDTKLYRLQTPTSPFFRPVHHDKIEMDSYAMGTNAVVAFVSYTGFDMEDAMVINKASLERGFAYGTIYSSEFIILSKMGSSGQEGRTSQMAGAFFCLDPKRPELQNYLGTDGLPIIGNVLTQGTPYYCYWNPLTSKYKTGVFSSVDEAHVDCVKLFINDGLPAACITLRKPRPPTIGDKFASRAGQKGICSKRFPIEDLPFTESGMVPDIVFNPHGIPSRMTIAMVLENMAGKAAAYHGQVYDATPFRFSEDDSAAEYFGSLLKEAGFNFYGTETMYSGITGEPLVAAIFMGVVHYQRLRHMVSDKWQVRSTGPVDKLTKQPIHGRRRGGGVRLGEMERDALLTHGGSFLLHDRLFHCSDKSSQWVCKDCGSLLSPLARIPRNLPRKLIAEHSRHPVCTTCNSKDSVISIEIPYIFKFLALHLVSMGIKVNLTFNNKDDT